MKRHNFLLKSIIFLNPSPSQREVFFFFLYIYAAALYGKDVLACRQAVGADNIRPPLQPVDFPGFPGICDVLLLRADEPPMTACGGNFIGGEIRRKGASAP